MDGTASSLEDQRGLADQDSGVVFALAMAVKAFTKVGDSILVQQPVYYPFSEVIRDNDRVIVSNDLILGTITGIISTWLILKSRSWNMM